MAGTILEVALENKRRLAQLRTYLKEHYRKKTSLNALLAKSSLLLESINENNVEAADCKHIKKHGTSGLCTSGCEELKAFLEKKLGDLASELKAVRESLWGLKDLLYRTFLGCRETSTCIKGSAQASQKERRIPIGDVENLVDSLLKNQGQNSF